MSASALNRESEAYQDGYVTFLKSNKYNYTWTIHDCSSWIAQIQGFQHSSTFPSGTQETIRWSLRFCPKATRDESFCGLHVQSQALPGPSLNAKVEIVLKDSRDVTVVRKTLQNDFKEQEVHGWCNLIKRDMLLKKIRPDDQLVIQCTIEVNIDIVNESLEGTLKQVPVTQPSSLLRDFGSLFDGGKFGDVSIMVQGQKFLAYKGILAARSSVFAAMFEHEMQENVKNCVTIDDVEANVFKELLRYIYTDKLTCLGTMSQELYAVADKYAVTTLKARCQNHILEKLNWETAADTLTLADMHSDDELKKHVLKFLGGNVAAKVTESAGWRKMTRTHPYLVDETVKALAARVPASKRK